MGSQLLQAHHFKLILFIEKWIPGSVSEGSNASTSLSCQFFCLDSRILWSGELAETVPQILRTCWWDMKESLGAGVPWWSSEPSYCNRKLNNRNLSLLEAGKFKIDVWIQDQTGLVTQACLLVILEAEAKGLEAQDWPVLQKVLKASLMNLVRLPQNKQRTQ